MTKILAVISILLLILILAMVEFKSSTTGLIEASLFANRWRIYFGSLVLSSLNQNTLFFLYSATGILIGLSLIVDQGWLFTSSCLILMAPLTGLLLSESVTSSALFLVLAAGVMAIMIQGEQPGSTITAFRTFTLIVVTVPGLLTINYLFGSRPGELLNWAPFFILVVGLILLYSFPFHLWVAPIVSKAKSFVPAVVFGLAQLVLLFFLFRILAEHPIIYRNTQLLELFNMSGLATIAIAGILLLTARTNRRLLAYLVLIDLGATTIAFGIGTKIGLELAIFLVINRFTSLLLVGFGLEMIQRALHDDIEETITRDGIASIARRSPLGVATFLFGIASIAGFPLTPGFAGRWALIRASDVGFAWQSAFVVVTLILAFIVLFRLYLPQRARVPTKDEMITSEPLTLRITAGILLAVGVIMTILSPLILVYIKGLVNAL